MSKKALLVQGGWDGHQPDLVAARFADVLKAAGFETTISDTLDAFADLEHLESIDLIVPIWTMGTIEGSLAKNVVNAVANGTGLAGCHGGMCDAFRDNVEWQFMTGGNWVSHPGGDNVTYPVTPTADAGELMEGIPEFQVTSEQYYLHVDPAVHVLATTPFPQAEWFHSPNGPVDMPVAWAKRWGAGRVYYNSLGHHADIFDIPEALDMMTRGLLWAAEGFSLARNQGLTRADFDSSAKMF